MVQRGCLSIREKPEHILNAHRVGGHRRDGSGRSLFWVVEETVERQRTTLSVLAGAPPRAQAEIRARAYHRHKSRHKVCADDRSLEVWSDARRGDVDAFEHSRCEEG